MITYTVGKMPYSTKLTLFQLSDAIESGRTALNNITSNDVNFEYPKLVTAAAVSAYVESVISNLVIEMQNIPMTDTDGNFYMPDGKRHEYRLFGVKAHCQYTRRSVRIFGYDVIETHTHAESRSNRFRSSMCRTP